MVLRRREGETENSSRDADVGMAAAAMGTPNATPATAGGGEEIAEDEEPGVST